MTVQGPVKKQPPDGMSHRGGGGRVAGPPAHHFLPQPFVQDRVRELGKKIEDQWQQSGVQAGLDWFYKSLPLDDDGQWVDSAWEHQECQGAVRKWCPRSKCCSPYSDETGLLYKVSRCPAANTHSMGDGGGGGCKVGISRIQILYESVVRNLFGVSRICAGVRLALQAPTVSHEQLLGTVHNLFAHF